MTNENEPLGENHMRQAKTKRLIENKLKHALKEIAVYSFSMWILFIVCYLNKDINSYKYQNNLRKTLGLVENIGEESTNVSAL